MRNCCGPTFRARICAIRNSSTRCCRLQVWSRRTCLPRSLKKADLRGAYLTGAIFRGAELDGANLAGADLRGASGITAVQVCSGLQGRSALMDPDLAAEVQLRCGASQ